MMAAEGMAVPRTLRLAILSSDLGWRQTLVERLGPVDDLRVVRHGDANDETDVEAVLSHRVDILVWDAVDRPGPSDAFGKAWGALSAEGRPALVVVAQSLSPELYRTCVGMGAHDVVLRDGPLPDLTECLYRSVRGRPRPIEAAADAPAPGRPGLVATVFSLRGGVGKTTLAIDLGAALRRRLGAPVAVLDMALSTGSVGISLGVRPARPLGELMADAAALDGETLRTYLTPHAPSGLFAMCAPEVPEVAEYVRHSHVAAIIAASRTAFGATVIDTSSGLGEADFAAAQESDSVVLVVGPDLPSAAAARLALDLFDRFDISRGKVGLVLNRWRAGGVAARDLEKNLKLPVWAVVGEDPAALRAMNGGVPVSHVRPRGPLGTASAALASRLVGEAAAMERRARLTLRRGPR